MDKIYRVFFFKWGIKYETYIEADSAEEALMKARKIDYRYVGVQKVEE